jgi:2-oxo-4-hydroxy-4-carboxy-5-ureidoimidazoline decarboxylase
MPEPHALVNALPADEARAALFRCCGSARWVAGMIARRPWASAAALYADAETTWAGLGRDDVLEAFAHHPRIGGRADQTDDAWARQEQARVGEADSETRRALIEANERYRDRFGYIFIVCASGKSAAEMLTLLEARLGNDPERELVIAAGEQARITRLRLEKLST